MNENGIDFGILNAPVSDVNKPSASTNDAFYRWLLTERGIGERWAREIRYIIGKILREIPNPILDEKKATDLVSVILTSKLSKSTKRHYLRATAKMDKQREILMSEQLQRVLMAYLATVPADNWKPSDPLFRSIRGDRIAPRTVGTIVEQASRRAGLEGVQSHVLRHSFATAWVDNGGDQFHLKDRLGHSNIKMTERYWHLNTKSKAEAFARAAPRF